jgi:deoxyribonuclease V
MRREQQRLGALTPAPWEPSDPRCRVAAAFVAFVRGEQGPGHPGDRAWVGAVLMEGPRRLRSRVVHGVAGASYAPGLLGRREGPMLADALAPFADAADVIMVDATGRDHPRGAGLAVHLGAVLDRPSIGVTHRGLVARGSEPVDEIGATAPWFVDGVEVARCVRTAVGVRPVLAHAAWRTSARTAALVVLATCAGARTPEPLRQARCVARTARAARTLQSPPEQESREHESREHE